MSPEKQQITIAEACGWTLCRADNKTWRTPEQKAKNLELLGHENGPWSFESSGPPDYLNDLNAMHEAEKRLRNQFNTVEEAYWRNLAHVQPHPIYATAAQRAEAFLRTLNLWTNDQ